MTSEKPQKLYWVVTVDNETGATKVVGADEESVHRVTEEMHDLLWGSVFVVERR